MQALRAAFSLQDFAPVAFGSTVQLQGTTYADTNASGRQDAGEPMYPNAQAGRCAMLVVHKISTHTKFMMQRKCLSLPVLQASLSGQHMLPEADPTRSALSPMACNIASTMLCVQVLYRVYGPSFQLLKQLSTSSDGNGSLSIAVPGSLNEVPGTFSLECQTDPRSGEPQVHWRKPDQRSLHAGMERCGRVDTCAA